MFGLFKKAGNEIEVADLNTKITNDFEKSILVDVRTLEEFAGGHIAEAVNYPLDELFQNINAIGQYEQIYVICRSGGRSAQAAMLLENAGIKGVHNVHGGMIAWESRSYPVVQ